MAKAKGFTASFDKCRLHGGVDFNSIAADSPETGVDKKEYITGVGRFSCRFIGGVDKNVWQFSLRLRWIVASTEAWIKKLCSQRCNCRPSRGVD